MMACNEEGFIKRYSSRRSRLDASFLTAKLQNAQSYDRIAGYFSSSILEVAGEALEQVKGKVRVVCNGAVEARDAATANVAANAQHREWCAAEPEKKYGSNPARLEKLYHLLKSGKLEVKVIPNDVFGLIHGKAGVITMADGSQTSFLGSVNETYSAWKLNYELMWEDSSPEAVAWVQAEFDYFWHHPSAVPLADFVVEDVGRIARRKILGGVEDWRKDPEPAEVAVESAVYRRELGLWEHQKAFISRVFHDHQKQGARYVLADQVGLGKTVQLAMSAQLMALYGDKPILVLVPKTLLSQWQEEMLGLLGLPSAIWLGKNWQDENGIVYPESDIRKCPRRIGIVSQGLIVSGRQELKEKLLSQEYECIIVDEAHRARRSNLGEGKEEAKPESNNLQAFLLKISAHTKSMLLATATPVQMYPIEAWDLLNILSQKDDSVLGSSHSMWRTRRKLTLDYVTGKKQPDLSIDGIFSLKEWLRDPLPPEEEDKRIFGQLRRELQIGEEEFAIKPEAFNKLMESPRTFDRVKRTLQADFMVKHNPFIRHIVRRTREFLERNGQLPRIEVILHGEKDTEALPLYGYLYQAYGLAEEFCKSLGERVRGAGFIKTMLLRRMGSSMLAGKLTAEKILEWEEAPREYFLLDEDEEPEEEWQLTSVADSKESHKMSLVPEERQLLQSLVTILSEHIEDDPKYARLLQILLEKGFADLGCIIFSQYFDSVNWAAKRLSEEQRFANEPIGLYAGSNKSGIYENGIFRKVSKDEIKAMVRRHEIRILTGTDAASEGLNLQTLGSLVNLDLPWNPTRLEQRKGRIQRIGQVHEKVHIYNMRYKGSVEDRVHELLSERLKEISDMFGQLPDVLQDVWIEVALDNVEKARKIIDNVPAKHPFELRYEKQTTEHVDWESCAVVLDDGERRRFLMNGWK